MYLSLLVASAQNGTIGINNSLPWHLAEDLKRFRILTTGHTVLMGRKTFESIGKPLPKRENFVLTQQNNLSEITGISLFPDLASAIETAQQAGETELFIIGGGSLYAQAGKFANRLYWTKVQANIAGDTFFLPPDLSEWRIVKTETFVADEKNDFPFQIEIWEKIE